jgi:hypothetical protein
MQVVAYDRETSNDVPVPMQDRSNTVMISKHFATRTYTREISTKGCYNFLNLEFLWL